MERDPRRGTERNFIHDFPRVPEARHFWQCALIEAHGHRPAAWYLADKVAQSCVHYEIQRTKGRGIRIRLSSRNHLATKPARSIVSPICPLPVLLLACERHIGAFSFFPLPLFQIKIKINSPWREINEKQERKREGRVVEPSVYVNHGRIKIDSCTQCSTHSEPGGGGGACTCREAWIRACAGGMSVNGRQARAIRCSICINIYSASVWRVLRNGSQTSFIPTCLPVP